jgi:hypothetical protein
VTEIRVGGLAGDGLPVNSQFCDMCCMLYGRSSGDSSECSGAVNWIIIGPELLHVCCFCACTWRQIILILSVK